MHILGLIITLLIVGLIAGALARLLVPGKDPMSVPATIIMGMLGQLIAGLIFWAIFNAAAGWIAGIIVTVGLVLISRRTGIGRRSNDPACMTWNPERYLAFADHRTRPAIDLLARVPLQRPERVADLGCGPGNSTRLLAERWPAAEVIGIDSSADMLAMASDSATMDSPGSSVSCR